MLFLPRDNIFPHRFLTLMRIYRKINSFLFLKVYRGDHTSQERRGTYKQGDRRSPVVKTPGFHCKGVRVWFLVRKLRPRMLYRVVKNKTNKNQGEETACVFHPSPLFSIQRYFLRNKKLPCTPVRRGNPQCKKRQHTLPSMWRVWKAKMPKPLSFASIPWESGSAICTLVQFSSVASDPLWPHGLYATPGLPVHHQLPEFTQTHVHWVDDAIQPSHPLSSPSPPAFNLSQHQGLFQWVSSSHQVAKVLEFQPQHQPFQWIFRTDFL